MSQSESLYREAESLMPGGVNSPVRAFRNVGGVPPFIKKASGAYLFDEDGNRYIDYVGSWGPMILGHAHPIVISALIERIGDGLGYGAPTEIENRMARKIMELVPSIEMVRMVSSGTEATMSAIRLGRGYTGRDKIVKFEGCYHGHSDSLLVKAGSGALTMGEPDSLGVPADLARHTLTLSYNDLDQVRNVFREQGEEIALVIVEPVAGNMNCVPPATGFLHGLRELCTEYGSLLIFDEVMTGFRVALGGAQALYGISPDLTTLGKVIGGGMPVGAFGGRRDIMEMLAPLGAVYQAGTLSGNPIAMTAGLATLEEVSKPGFYEEITNKVIQLVDGLQNSADQCGIGFKTNRVGGMFGLFFTAADKVSTFDDVMNCDKERFRKFFHLMLASGVNFAPSPFEAGFVSSAHSTSDIDQTIDAATAAFKTL